MAIFDPDRRKLKIGLAIRLCGIENNNQTKSKYCHSVVEVMVITVVVVVMMMMIAKIKKTEKIVVVVVVVVVVVR